MRQVLTLIKNSDSVQKEELANTAIGQLEAYKKETKERVKDALNQADTLEKQIQELEKTLYKEKQEPANNENQEPAYNLRPRKGRPVGATDKKVRTRRTRKELKDTNNSKASGKGQILNFDDLTIREDDE